MTKGQLKDDGAVWKEMCGGAENDAQGHGCVAIRFPSACKAGATDRVTGRPTVTPVEMGVSPLLIVKTDRDPPPHQVFSYWFWGR